MKIVELYLILILLFLVINIGYTIGYIRSIAIARVLSWTLVMSSIITAHIVSIDFPPVFRMLSIITATLFSMKAIVLVEVYKGECKLNYFQWLAFSVGWFGMRPQIFEKLRSESLNDVNRIFIKGFTRILIGLFFLVCSVCVSRQFNFHYFVSGLLALVGLSFILHFGVLNISTAQWRFLGVDCRELFRSPGLSMSLKEFWGKRWNMAFSEMTALVLYRPLKEKFGKLTGVIFAFLFSGILHELAISLPVESGYGLPMLYFCIHGILMLVEDRIDFVKKITAHKIFSRIWVLTWLVLPMPLLFHKEFMIKIVFPLTDLIISILY